ncbi:LytR/AlgR family response regulator transcription factor [Alkaliphilus peptidifermentans]|uniref:Stage 0 sporulation protein A homolog n=1 Tax=Alkaliphilus peptidifermentans DSM 18978 TaxID=1120976 RepID=A0A1G5FD99_9FIRM|nr:LytTR family DNA-binding domain-containing protein [Alkaliphilus peptidifermentans]SCY37157.1 two component transcriptional regulator, LytTR family [Alkaliphilus peptidifermentans DSM 18978]
MINILICDDNEYIRKMLEEIALRNHLISKVFVARDGLEAVKAAEDNKIDIALLDISMPKLNGIDTAKLICKIHLEIHIIFITGHMEYAIESYTVHPYHYLLKPLDIEAFRETLNELAMKILNTRKQPKLDMLKVNDNGNTLMLPLEDILFFEKIGKATVAHTNEEGYVVDKTLIQLENRLSDNFIRTHQSFIVNTKKISKIKDIGNRSYNIELKGTKKIACMSRIKFEKLKKTFTF